MVKMALSKMTDIGFARNDSKNSCQKCNTSNILTPLMMDCHGLGVYWYDFWVKHWSKNIFEIIGYLAMVKVK